MKKNLIDKLYKQALRLREVENKISEKYEEQRMRCPTHLSIGQEAVSAAFSQVVKKTDFAVSTHRCHTHYLGKGGSLENAIVVKENEILNEEGLRNKNEFVNHKILDCMGDLYLVGYRIIGSLKSRQGGHNLTNKLLRKVFSDNENYSLLEIKGKNLPHSLIINRQYLKSIA